MAAFTSAQNGDWDDGATFGNASPGVKGTDWPGNAGDTASIGHTVTYNVSETNEMGAITITSGGILTFDTAADTKLTMAHEDILIQDGGELRVGASGAVIDAAQTAELIWNTTGDNQKGINVNDNGILNIYGDPAYYGSDDETTLADNAENTDGDAIIKTQDDMSALWNVNDEITIHIKNLYSNYNTDVVLGVIQSFDVGDGTLITLDINVTSDAGCVGKVINVTRNVKLYKLGADTTIGQYNTNRPRIYDVNAVGNDNCVVSNSVITGFYYIISSFDFVFADSVIRNGSSGFWGGEGHTISGAVYSNSDGFRGGFEHTISGEIYSNTYGLNGGLGHILRNNSIGWDGAVSRPNTTDFRFNELDRWFLYNVEIPDAGFGYFRRNYNGFKGGLFCIDYDKTHGAYRTFLVFATLTKIVSPAGYTNSDESIQVEPLSNCNSDNVVYFLGGEVETITGMPIQLSAAEHTITVYMQCSGWASIPTNTECYIELTYYDGSDWVTAVSTDVFAANDTWKAFTVTATPGAAGPGYLKGVLKDYESGASIIAEAVPSVDGKKIDNIIDWIVSGNQPVYNPDAGAGLLVHPGMTGGIRG